MALNNHCTHQVLGNWDYSHVKLSFCACCVCTNPKLSRTHSFKADKWQPPSVLLVRLSYWFHDTRFAGMISTMVQNAECGKYGSHSEYWKQVLLWNWCQMLFDAVDRVGKVNILDRLLWAHLPKHMRMDEMNCPAFFWSHEFPQMTSIGIFFSPSHLQIS